ncbi:hypothetical protein GE21DRAFT_1277198 [Neurospora crassa]|nr:hypothetical protein GE21DRAFT_1277198 [Neurospora crassa]
MSFYLLFLAAAKSDHAGTDHKIFPRKPLNTWCCFNTAATGTQNGAGMVILYRLIPHRGTFEPDLPSQPPSPGVVFDFEYIVVIEPYPEHSQFLKISQSIISAASPDAEGCNKKASSLCVGFSAL